MSTFYKQGPSLRWAQLLSLLLLLPFVGQAQVVISQVYGGGGGGTTGTLYTRDYVELFNRGAAAVDIRNYNIQYASATGTSYTPNAVTATPGTTINLQPGQYYTVVLGGTGTAGATIAQGTGAGQADYVLATPGSSISNTAGKIALTSSSTALVGTAATTPPASAALVDFVGFGVTASAYEGTGRAPAPTNTASALFRASSGCTDSNDNTADFANATPVVRNMSTTLAPCNAPPTAAEINVKQGATDYLTGSTYSGFASTTVGSSSAKIFTIQNTGGTVLNLSSIAATNDFSVTGTVPTTVAANSTANVTVTFTPSVAGTRTGTLTINSDDANEAAYTIDLSATATTTTPDPMIAVTQGATPYAEASTYSGFASTFVGSTSAMVTFTITNASMTDALAISGITTTGNFAVSGTVPTTVAANSSATFDLTFSPTAGGTRTGTVTIDNNSQASSSYVINLSGTGTVPAPTLTAIAPTNPVGGATYSFTLTGTNFGTIANTTVSFNGTTVVPTFVNGTGTSLTVALPLPAAGGTFPITVTTANGTSGSQSLTVAALPAGFFEPFEPGTQAGYPVTATAVALRTGSYDFVQALLGSLANDKFNNAQGARLRGGGSITMGFDKTGGAGVVTVSAALYGTESGATLAVEYSTNGGMSYTAAPGSPATLTNTLTPYMFTLNVPGAVRLRFITSNTTVASNPRINIDDLQITNYTALPNLVVNTGTPLSPTPITGNYNNVTIAAGGYAVLAGPLTVAGTLAIQAGGGLLQGGLGLGCQVLSGTGNFDLQAGGTFAMCAPAGIAPTGVPTGAVLLLGTRTYSPLAQYIYTGNAAQVTGLGLPSTVLAMGVQNAFGVTLSQALSLTQGLNLSQGDLTTDGFAFTLLSSATGTAGVVNTGGVVVGSTTVQRYINSSNPIGYRHYSAPVSNTSMADLSAPGFTPTFNPNYNTSATPGTETPFPTVFGYNQSRIATVTSNFSAFDKGWFSPAGLTAPMVVARGYTVNAPNTALIDFVGTLNNGAVNSGTLSRGPDAAAGWQLLGNPYPSPLDWSTVGAGQRPGMDAAIYVFESAGQYGGSYRANVNGVGGNGNSGNALVVSSQGYFARVTAPNGTGSVNLTNANRVTTFGAQPSFGRSTADLRPQLRLELLGNGLADRAHVYFQAGATNSVDSEFDAVKLPNPTGLNLASVTDAENLAINGLPALAAATVLVPLHVAVPQAGSYSLNAGDLTNLAGTTVTLIDAQTNTRTVLAAGTTYAFSLTNTTAAGRFSVEFRPTGALATTPAQALAAQTQLFPNPASASFRVQLPVLSGKATVQATLLNALGQTVLRRSLSAAAGQAIDAEFDVRALAAGVYTLRLDVNGTPVTRKVVVE